MQDFKTGIQLYTLREQLENDFHGCLNELAVMGYDGVEFAGMYGGQTAEQLADELRELGLSVCGMHLPLTAIMDKTDGTFVAVGTGLIDLPGVIGVARDSIAEWVIYEQDACSCSPFDSARISIENINKLKSRE